MRELAEITARLKELGVSDPLARLAANLKPQPGDGGDAEKLHALVERWESGEDAGIDADGEAAPEIPIDPARAEKLRAEREVREAEKARQKAAEGAWEALGDVERTRRLQEALEEVLSDLSTGVARRSVERAGVAHRLVVARAMGKAELGGRSGGYFGGGFHSLANETNAFDGANSS